jgi:hypothetical protein
VQDGALMFKLWQECGMQKEKPQADRFEQAARELCADESDDALDRTMSKLDLKKKPGPEPKHGKTDE